MEAFKKTFHSMRSDGRIHKSGSSDEFPEELSTPDDGWEKAKGSRGGGGRGVGTGGEGAQVWMRSLCLCAIIEYSEK